ncbi:N-acetyltransferase [Litorimonas cladophorae]|uniref:N-acetyltransferase n=1 Tax=Litorimonas cladophorae TaxID=1220491 RepID=A0A918KG35_9PROT|nr:GNAT family N-acetyltransferase [Litorimonas cladophorae]GGX62459.1 N-acetyltransferase [Litorimonas cladophorae]
METKIVDISDPQVQELVELHLTGMMDNSPPGHVFALDSSGLADPRVTLFGAWDDEVLLGIGALKLVSDTVGEVKSMRVRPDAIGRGIGKAILEAIISEATACGFKRLSLETGSGAGFDAAIGLYVKRGFERGDAFGEYTASDFNQFFHLDL